MGRLVAGIGSQNAGFRGVHSRGLRLNVCVCLNVLLQQETVALLNRVAFFDQNISDAAEALSLHVGISGRLDFSRRRDQRDQTVLLGDLGGLNGDNTLIGLVHAVENDARPDHCDGGANRRFLPHLHNCCFLFMPRRHARVGASFDAPVSYLGGSVPTTVAGQFCLRHMLIQNLASSTYSYAL